jgi:cytoskeleton protein RodZ
MEGFGKFLQQAREKKQLSLEDVASQTRIQQKYLEALESENFASLPGKVFAKGFVRSYAKTIGLDDEEALQRFLDASRNFYEQHHLEQQHHHTTVQAEHRGKFNRNLVLGVFILLGIGLFYFLPSQQEVHEPGSEADLPSLQEPADTSPSPTLDSPNSDLPSLNQNKALSPSASVTESSPTQEPQASHEIPPEPQSVPNTEQPKPLVTPTPEPNAHASTSPATQNGGYLLEIEATQLTWVVVRSDDQSPNEALLQPGQRLTWKATNQFLLTLGNAAGVVVRLNGEPQGPFGKAGQVVRDILIKP